MPVSQTDPVLDCVRKHNLSGEPSPVGMDAIDQNSQNLSQNANDGTPYNGETASQNTTASDNTVDKIIDEKAGEIVKNEVCIGPCADKIAVLGKKQNAWFLSCLMCDGKLCSKCSGVKKTELNSMNTANDKVVSGNIGWVCDLCMLSKTNSSPPASLTDQMSDNQGHILALKGDMDALKKQVTNAVQGINNFSSNLASQMRAIMNETLFGDDFPEFDPSISHAQAKRLAKEHNRPAPPTIQSVIHNSALEQKNAEKKEDTEKAIARCNIIVYGLDEPSENDGEKRKTETNEKLNEILGFLEVPGIVPVKMHRLGKFKAETEGETSKPRPLKIILNSLDEATTIINSCKKLKNAPAHLKKLSISHDLTNEERSFIREEVKKARDLTAKSSTLDYKVVGPPWQPRIQSFKRRDLA